MDVDLSLISIKTFLVTYGLKLSWGLAYLFIGFKLSDYASVLLGKVLDKKQVDENLKPFIKSLATTFLKVAVVIGAAGTIGFETTSIMTIFASMGLAVGLALQGSLSNFAGGVMILLLKPFKSGDFIEAQGFTGVVDKVNVFNTNLTTGDNKLISIPNGPLASGSITNYSVKATRRVDFTFGIGYGDDLKLAKDTIEEIMLADSRVLKDPALQIVVGELADSSVNIICRAWTISADYWGVYFDNLEKVKLTFDEKNISIPFPQTDVHLHKCN